MENSEIQIRLKEVKSLESFAKLLNDIRLDEFGIAKHKITVGKLKHFSTIKLSEKRYKTFYIRKKSGGLREINAPCYQLSFLLYILNIVFKAVYKPCSSVMGFTEGRSVVENASMHVGHHYVFNIDLENFFPSIPQARVWARLQLPPFKFSQEIANVVAGLCCHVNAEGTGNVLPQGAATSPLLTNAICDKLDRRMRGVAKRFGLHYSRYADDMTFSSMHNVYQEGSDFRKEIQRVIEDQGFKMNDKKTRLLREGERQEVTGLIVNERVNVTKKYARDLRCLLHVWEKEGYGRAYAYFYPYYKREKGYIKKGEPVMENVIAGKLNYMRMVKGAENTTYMKLAERFEKLQQMVFMDTETDEQNSYVYVYSYKVSDFQKNFNTKISLTFSNQHHLVGKCVLDGMDKVLSVSKSAQNLYCKNRESLLPGCEVVVKGLEKWFVTLCRSKGKNFWLISKKELIQSKCLNLKNVKVNIDNLLDIWEKEGMDKAAQALKDVITCNHSVTNNQSMTNSEETTWCVLDFDKEK